MALLILLAGVGPGYGCYYAHLAWGQARMLLARRPVHRLLEDSNTPLELRRRLELVQETRRFAAGLGLHVGRQYTSYVAWPADRLITAVAATRAGSVETANFRFPIIGEAPYKGFFDDQRAEREAESLRRQGMDVCLVPVSAYSTLGWLNDPVTEPMLRYDDGELVELLLHELVHATIFVKSQPDFNEGVANFVGQEASVRFFATRDTPEAATDTDAPDFEPTPPEKQHDMNPSARRRAQIRDDRLLAVALAQIRDQIRELYAQQLADEQRVARREAIDTEARDSLAELPFETHDALALAQRIPLNDACLALNATYTSDTERYTAIFEGLEEDLPAFIERLKRAAADDDPRAAFFREVGE